MKKIVVYIIFLSALFLCSCTSPAPSNSNELTRSFWSSSAQGGAEVELSFEQDTATLKMKNGNYSAEIKGRYIADEKSFAIFVPEIHHNYYFEYIPQGDKLKLKYNGHTIELKAEKKKEYRQTPSE